MKHIAINVVILATVNEDVNPEEISLAIPLGQIRLLDIDGGEILSAKVASYETVDVDEVT